MWMSQSATSARLTGFEGTMSDETASLTPSTFEAAIRRYCEEYGWEIDQFTNDIAVLNFESDSGTVQTVAIFPLKDMVSFVAHSDLGFDSDDDIPHRLSTHLLRSNSGLLLGSWSIDDIHSKSVFALKHDDEMRVMDAHRFERIVRYLVKACGEFEQAADSL